MCTSHVGSRVCSPSPSDVYMRRPWNLCRLALGGSHSSVACRQAQGNPEL